jgi:sulfatase maturation enzyme AslB (radical SAM superfamily)
MLCVRIVLPKQQHLSMLKQAEGTQCNHNCDYCTVQLSFTSAKLVQNAVRNRNDVSRYIMLEAF